MASDTSSHGSQDAPVFDMRLEEFSHDTPIIMDTPIEYYGGQYWGARPKDVMNGHGLLGTLTAAVSTVTTVSTIGSSLYSTVKMAVSETAYRLNDRGYRSSPGSQIKETHYTANTNNSTAQAISYNVHRYGYDECATVSADG